MPKIQPTRVHTISEFHRAKGVPSPDHPLISVIDYGAIACHERVEAMNWIFDFYQISIKRGFQGKLKYGQQEYDYDNGVMFFISPNQTFRIEPESAAQATAKRSGWMLLIHPDFLWNTPLAKRIKQFEFFDYSVHEALFLSEKEEETIFGVIQNIQQEIQANIDQYTQRIIISQIETLLHYSERFYQRQFITRQPTNHRILDRLEEILNQHFQQENAAVQGLPSVQAIADQLNVTPNYLSGVLRSLTGQTTQQHIHEKLIEKAKERLSTTELSVSEIAYALGFEHPQSFSKLFKAKTNQSPQAFRAGFN